MQISSLTMHDTKIYEAESDSMEKNWSRISHKINDWLINQISTEISLPTIYTAYNSRFFFKLSASLLHYL